MYPNLKAEIARKNLTLKDIKNELHKRGFKMTIATLSQKLTGKAKLTLAEAKALKEITGATIPLEELFEEAV